MESIIITPQLRIPASELAYSFDRSPGPGGQNVNKLNTRVELRFNIIHSRALREKERYRLGNALHRRLTSDGELIVRSSRFRTQSQNKEDCINKLVEILSRSLQPPPPRRRRTRPNRAAVRRRLDAKRRHAEKKMRRQRPFM